VIADDRGGQRPGAGNLSGTPSDGDPAGPAVADVLHDLGQPLAAIRALTATPLPGRREAHQEEAGERLRQIGELAEWMAKLLRRGSESVADAPARADAAAVIGDLLAVAAASFEGTLRYRRLSSPAPVPVDPTELRRAFGNVLDNALRAAGPRGRVEVRLRRVRDRVRVEVEDNGPGFGRVPSRTGRGLAVTQSVLDRCDGVLEIAGSRSGGSLVRLELPLAGSDVPA
jgi:two-component system sensor histidine kinase TctE